MPGFHVAAALVSLFQFLRLHDVRFLPVSALFAFSACARFFGDGSWPGFTFDLLGGCCGLALVYILSPRHPHHSHPSQRPPAAA